MRYKIKDNHIVEQPLMPVKIYPLNILISFLIMLPGLYFFYWCCANGWDNYDENGNWVSANVWQGCIAIMGSIFGLLATAFVILVVDKVWWKNKTFKSYNLGWQFNKDYFYLDLYKEAYEDCLAEIKAGAFNESYWKKSFSDLSDQCEVFEKKQKALREEQMPRKDYALAMKTFNQQYFGEGESDLTTYRKTLPPREM